MIGMDGTRESGNYELDDNNTLIENINKFYERELKINYQKVINDAYVGLLFPPKNGA